MAYSPVESCTKYVFNINDYLKLSVKVTLASRDMGQRRRKFMVQKDYHSNWYRDVSSLSSVYISTQDFLLLESDLPFSKRENVQDYRVHRIAFSYDNLHVLFQTLSKAYTWLAQDGVFKTEDDNDFLSVVGTTMPYARCDSMHLKQMSDIVLTLSPTIQTNAFNKNERAVLFTFGVNPPVQVTSITLHQLSSILYFLQHFDLCTCATAIVNQTIVGLPFLIKKEEINNDNKS